MSNPVITMAANQTKGERNDQTLPSALKATPTAYPRFALITKNLAPRVRWAGCFERGAYPLHLLMRHSAAHLLLLYFLNYLTHLTHNHTAPANHRLYPGSDF